MQGFDLNRYRKDKRRTQVETAGALGVSQTYLSLLEAGKRPLTEGLRRKAVRYFDLPASEMPARFSSGELAMASDDEVAADLADLGYLGFGHLKRKRPRRQNPADVLLGTLAGRQRDARIIEALPWLVLTYPDLEWPEVIKAAKIHDLQNRLGFVVSLAGEIADAQSDTKLVEKLRSVEQTLERSMLAAEDTLCNQGMTKAERDWVRSNRSVAAENWRILTGLTSKLIRYA